MSFALESSLPGRRKPFIPSLAKIHTEGFRSRINSTKGGSEYCRFETRSSDVEWSFDGRNQDRGDALASAEYVLAAVADGVGMGRNSEKAAEVMVDRFRSLAQQHANNLDRDRVKSWLYDEASQLIAERLQAWI